MHLVDRLWIGWFGRFIALFASILAAVAVGVVWLAPQAGVDALSWPSAALFATAAGAMLALVAARLRLEARQFVARQDPPSAHFPDEPAAAPTTSPPSDWATTT